LDRTETLAALRRGDLGGARELRLPDGLAEFPREVLDLADTLEVLDLGRGSLTTLPDDLGRLRRLRVLFGSGNPFARLPPVLGDCPTLSQLGFRGCGIREVPPDALPRDLRWLTLTDNQIEHLPDTLGERPLLQKLMLSGNRIAALP
jgi:Leucine-rich repeat (LRR) protein